MNPYLILGVPHTADDAEIRKAYLSGVRDHPPERDPARFQSLTNAYQKVASRQSRLEHFLFDESMEGATPLGALAAYCKNLPPPGPLASEAMTTLLRECSKT
jgi:curved DNA-binding protein CbpA